MTDVSPSYIVPKLYPPPPVVPHPREDVSFLTPGKTVPHHPLGDSHQVTVPPPPGGPHYHRKEFSIRYVQRAANVRRPTP